MTQTFTIPGKLPSQNDANRAGRSHWIKAARMKRETQDFVGWCIKAARLKPVTSPTCIAIHFFEPNRRRDLDNIAGFASKVILDALVQQRVLADDSPRYVKGISYVWSVDKGNPRVVVMIEEDLR